MGLEVGFRDGLAPIALTKSACLLITGCRFLAFDLKMPNHQIVECYIVFAEMEAAKKNDDPTATVCADLSNHEVGGVPLAGHE